MVGLFSPKQWPAIATAHTMRIVETMKRANGARQRVRRIPWLPRMTLMLVILVLVGAITIGNRSVPDCNRGLTQDEYDRWSYTVSDAKQTLAPQWSPDGSHIVFTNLSRPEHLWLEDDVYSIASDGSRLRSVSKNARWPSISPDGSRIAYGTTRAHQRLPYYIETSKLDGSDRRRLTEQALKDLHLGLNDVSPAWSPDGQRIAFARFTPASTEGRGIYTMDADGSAQRRLFRFLTTRVGDARTDVYRWGPVWSPDGEKLAFVVQEFQTHSIYESVNRYVLYTMNADGSGLTRAFAGILGKSVNFEGPAIDRIWQPPAWSLDDQKLVFARRIRSDYKDFAAGEEIEAPPGVILNTINPDGSGLRTVVEFAGASSADNLFWSPNGNDILFTLSEVPTTFVGSRVYIADADGGGYRQVGKGSFASWSADGSKIAVIDFSDVYLYTVAPDGSDVLVLVRREDDGDLKAAR